MDTTAQISSEDGIIIKEQVNIRIYSKEQRGDHIDISGQFWLPYGTRHLQMKSTVNAQLADGESWKLQIREPGDMSRGIGYLFNAHALNPPQ
jgi:hypothetical protein